MASKVDDIALTLQERYNTLIGNLGQVNIVPNKVNIDVKELDTLIGAVKNQMEGLQSTRKSEVSSQVLSSTYALATIVFAENKPEIDLIAATIAASAADETAEFALPFFKRALAMGVSTPGFITIDPLLTNGTKVKIDINAREILGTQQELEQVISETRAIMHYGGKVNIHMANLFWMMDYRAAREGVVPYKEVEFKKPSTYRKYGYKSTKGGGIHLSATEVGAIGSTVKVPDQARFRRGVTFYRRVTDTRIGLSNGKALFWYLIEHGTRTIKGRAGGRPYPEFAGTHFITKIQGAVEAFLYQKLIATYPSAVYQAKNISAADYGPEIDRLIKLRDELISLKEEYLDILRNPGGGPVAEKAYKKNFKKRVDSVLASMDAELETKFSGSQRRENMARARLELGLLRVIEGTGPKDNRIYLGRIEGRTIKKRLTLLARDIQNNLPDEQAKLFSLLKDMKVRMTELNKVLEINAQAMAQAKRLIMARKKGLF